MTNSQPFPSSYHGNQKIMNFTKLLEKTELPEKFAFLARGGFKSTQKRRADSCPPTPCPGQPPFVN